MKKLVLLLIVIFPMVLSSCDLSTKYDVTVKNECPFDIYVNISLSVSEPETYIRLDTDKTTVFNVSNAVNNIHVKAVSSNNVTYPNADAHTVLPKYANKNETWIIRWDSVTPPAPHYIVLP